MHLRQLQNALGASRRLAPTASCKQAHPPQAPRLRPAPPPWTDRAYREAAYSASAQGAVPRSESGSLRRYVERAAAQDARDLAEALLQKTLPLQLKKMMPGLRPSDALWAEYTDAMLAIYDGPEGVFKKMQTLWCVRLSEDSILFLADMYRSPLREAIQQALLSLCNSFFDATRDAEPGPAREESVTSSQLDPGIYDDGLLLWTIVESHMESLHPSDEDKRKAVEAFCRNTDAAIIKQVAEYYRSPEAQTILHATIALRPEIKALYNSPAISRKQEQVMSSMFDRVMQEEFERASLTPSTPLDRMRDEVRLLEEIMSGKRPARQSEQQ